MTEPSARSMELARTIAPMSEAELLAKLRDSFVGFNYSRSTVEFTIPGDVALALLRQYRDAHRREERDSHLDTIYAAYLGICVLQTMCRKAGLTMGVDRSKELLVELGTVFPEIAKRVGKSALRTTALPTTEPEHGG